jgi:hypothetical protein
MQRQNFNVLLRNERIVQSIFENLHPKTVRIIKEDVKKEREKEPEPPFSWDQFKLIVGGMTALFTVLSFLIRWDVLLAQYGSFWAFLVIYQKGWLSRKAHEVNVYQDRNGKLKVTSN